MAFRSLNRLARPPEATARPLQAIPKNRNLSTQMPPARGRAFSFAVQNRAPLGESGDHSFWEDGGMREADAKFAPGLSNCARFSGFRAAAA
ncbi:MAG TPA: hypothetical protein VMF05_02975, partial [Stellaceae bacterium]|nr:hypothetical protein [Stellaceae bacterium]